jgi:ABC-type ATPase involved in cell division
MKKQFAINFIHIFFISVNIPRTNFLFMHHEQASGKITVMNMIKKSIA